MPVTLTDDDEGKTVVDASGATLGLVTTVEGAEAFVEPEPGFTETLKSSLGMGEAESDEYTVHQDAIESRDGDTLRLRGEL